ncbi:MAG: A24 family peptidase C-terminal domain-containing protein [Candidatus Heimdallarchaeota archaeon]
MVSSELNLLLLSAVILLLAVASWQDIQSREVTDWIWFGIAGMGIIVHGLSIFELALVGLSPLPYSLTVIINIITGILIALLLGILGLGGEADRISFIAISTISPVTDPFFGHIDARYELLLDILPRILNTFCNSYLAAVPVPLVIFGYNLIKNRSNPRLYSLADESYKTRFIVRFIGYPRDTSGLKNDLMAKPWHYDLLEDYSETQKWHVDFRFQLDSPEGDLARKRKTIELIESTGKQVVWIQPSLPFILFISLGFLLDLVFGNVVFLGISLLI